MNILLCQRLFALHLRIKRRNQKTILISPTHDLGVILNEPHTLFQFSNLDFAKFLADIGRREILVLDFIVLRVL